MSTHAPCPICGAGHAEPQAPCVYGPGVSSDELDPTTPPGDGDLVAFARLLIGDAKPFLDPVGLESAIARHRDLWVKLYRVDAGLEEIDELRPAPTAS